MAIINAPMTPDDQLEKWVAGQPAHNKDRDECCPDFSCCQPKLLAEQSVREAFQRSNYDVRNEMLMMFLGKLLEGRKVHFAGGPYEHGA